LSKKQKRSIPKQVPTKHQASKWQRQARMRRFIIIGAAIFLAVIIGWVGYGYYNDRIQPLHETVIEVNDVSFDMGYYVKTLDAYTTDMEPAYIDYMVSSVASQIVQDEIIRQGANDLGIYVTAQEVAEKIEENQLPKDKVYQDIISAGLLREKLIEYFDLQLPDTMEQAHVQTMLVESEQVADDVIAKIEGGGNLAALVDQFSCQPQVEGDLAWLPRELMPNTFIGEAAFSLQPGESHKIYDKSATKNVGYWLIEVDDTAEEQGINTRAMLLGNKTEAEEVKAKLVSEDFTALAKEYSQHDSKDNGGELGWLKQGDMNSEAFDEAAFGLTIGEVSEPIQDKSVQTTGGYWVITVLGREERVLSEEARIGLAQNDFNDWYAEQSGSSIINNYLDEEKNSWAVARVKRGR
jgi:parvulin-like peptidyl-prolyl isomerase